MLGNKSVNGQSVAKYEWVIRERYDNGIKTSSEISARVIDGARLINHLPKSGEGGNIHFKALAGQILKGPPADQLCIITECYVNGKFNKSPTYRQEVAIEDAQIQEAIDLYNKLSKPSLFRRLLSFLGV